MQLAVPTDSPAAVPTDASSAALLTWKLSRDREDPERRQSDVGGTARQAFISCFCAGQLARGLSNAAQIFLCNGERCVHDWRCALLRGLADVPFLAAYGLFVANRRAISSARAGNVSMGSHSIPETSSHA